MCWSIRAVVHLVLARTIVEALGTTVVLQKLFTNVEGAA
jgi:hypothetical protein